MLSAIEIARSLDEPFLRKPDGLPRRFTMHHGRQAVGALADSMRSAGLVPTELLCMDPAYLADGHEGEFPEALVAYEQDRAVAYLPFIVREASLRIRVSFRRAITLPYRELRGFGYQTSNPDDTVLAREMWSRLLSETRGYHRAALAEMQADNPLAMVLASCRRSFGRSQQSECTAYDSYRVDLRSTFDNYLRDRLNPKSRSTLRRKLRKLDELGQRGARCEVFTSPSQVGDFLRYGERVARNSYQWARKLPVLRASERTVRRLSDLATRNSWRGYILFSGDEPLAYCQGTVYRRRYDYDVPGYDERYASYSPGTVLLYYILEDLFQSGVADELDFGAGPAEYKRQFATHQEQVVYASASRWGLYPSLLRTAELASRGAARAVKWARAALRMLPGSALRAP